MKLEKSTVLVIGGSAGIGLEIARLFDGLGATVLVTGRNEQRLRNAVKGLQNAVAIPFDVTNNARVDWLVERIRQEFQGLNILVNNAGFGHTYSITSGSRAWEKAGEEMNTNYLAMIRITEDLMGTLLRQKEAAIVNVTSIAAIAPNVKIPTYSASKAAVHSYTEGLRLALRESPVKVFELMPPLVATEFSASIGGLENGIPAEQVAAHLIEAMQRDEYEIHVGRTAHVYQLARTSPTAALHAVNGIKEN